MLLTSFFMLNRYARAFQARLSSSSINPNPVKDPTNTPTQSILIPLPLSNISDRAAMLKRVQIPDVLPSDLPPGSNSSLVAGDFEEVYGWQDGDADPDEPSAGLWDAVLTCFFIDIVNYLRIIHRILAHGGVWINLDAVQYITCLG